MSPDNGQPPEKADREARRRKDPSPSSRLSGRSLIVSLPKSGPLGSAMAALLLTAPWTVFVGWITWPTVGWLLAVAFFLIGLVSGARETDEVQRVDFEDDGYVLHDATRSWNLPLSALREVTVQGCLYGSDPRTDEFTRTVQIWLRFRSGETVFTAWSIKGDSAGVACQLRALLPPEGVEFRHEIGWTEILPSGDRRWVCVE